MRWGMLWDIPGADLGLERVLLAGQVHFQAIAAKYRAGSIYGDRDRRGHPVGFGEHAHLIGGDCERHLGSPLDRKRVVYGQRVSVRVDVGGRGIFKKKTYF